MIIFLHEIETFLGVAVVKGDGEGRVLIIILGISYLITYNHLRIRFHFSLLQIVQHIQVICCENEDWTIELKQKLENTADFIH